jgi:phytoene/squalene synthetase
MDEFVSVPEFNLQFDVARDVISASHGESLAQEQERLRELVARMEEKEREWATDVINSLPELTRPSPPPSALMLEAMEIQRQAASRRGSRDEMVAALKDARKRIWAIADNAASEEGPAIRGLTRTLDHLEDALTDPDSIWELPEDHGN